MKITDLFKLNARTFSFEFFPPKDEISAVEFGINVGQLMRLSPSFVTVTYGAGGSTQERTFNLVDLLENNIGLLCMAHYTCINASREKITSDIEYLYNRNIRNLMLLRGDPPHGQTFFTETPGGFNHANDLISFVKEQNRFCIGGAAYPIKHPEAQSIEKDILNLKNKVEAGAEFLITQFFFENDVYFDFIEKANKIGIYCRIIPGLIPITNFKQINRFTQLSGAKIPLNLFDKLEKFRHNDEEIYKIGVEFAIRQAEDLLKKGAPGIHFYTLNKSRATIEIYEALSVKE